MSSATRRSVQPRTVATRQNGPFHSQNRTDNGNDPCLSRSGRHLHERRFLWVSNGSFALRKRIVLRGASESSAPDLRNPPSTIQTGTRKIAAVSGQALQSDKTASDIGARGRSRSRTPVPCRESIQKSFASRFRQPSTSSATARSASHKLLTRP